MFFQIHKYICLNKHAEGNSKFIERYKHFNDFSLDVNNVATNGINLNVSYRFLVNRKERA